MIATHNREIMERMAGARVVTLHDGVMHEGCVEAGGSL